MEVSTPVSVACADVSLEDAVLSAKAKVANVEKSAVTVQCVDGGDSNGRRLQETGNLITWIYQIIVGSEDQANSIVTLIEEKNNTAMASEITSFLSEDSEYKTIAVTVSAPTLSVVTVTTTSTKRGPGPDEPQEPLDDDDSHAHTPAALGAVAMAVVTATLTLSH